MTNYESKAAREAERAKARIEKASEFRRKRDNTGGGYVSELEYSKERAAVDPWEGFCGFYDLGFYRGFKQGQEATKKRYQKKIEALEAKLKALEG